MMRFSRLMAILFLMLGLGVFASVAMGVEHHRHAFLGVHLGEEKIMKLAAEVAILEGSTGIVGGQK